MDPDLVQFCLEAALCSGPGGMLLSIFLLLLGSLGGYAIIRGWIRLWNAGIRSNADSAVSLLAAGGLGFIAVLVFGSMCLPKFVEARLRDALIQTGKTEPVSQAQNEALGIMDHYKKDSSTLAKPFLTVADLRDAARLCDLVRQTAIATLGSSGIPFLTKVLPYSSDYNFASRVSLGKGGAREIYLPEIAGLLAESQHELLKTTMGDVMCKARREASRLCVFFSLLGVVVLMIAMSICSVLAWRNIFSSPTGGH
jgi:hypothetical protein